MNECKHGAFEEFFGQHLDNCTHTRGYAAAIRPGYIRFDSAYGAVGWSLILIPLADEAPIHNMLLEIYM